MEQIELSQLEAKSKENIVIAGPNRDSSLTNPDEQMEHIREYIETVRIDIEA